MTKPMSKSLLLCLLLLVPTFAFATEAELDRDVWKPFVAGVNQDKPELYVGVRAADFHWVAPGSKGRVMDLAEYDDDSRRVMAKRKEDGTTSEMEVRFLERNVKPTFAAEKVVIKFTMREKGKEPQTSYGIAHYFSRKENGVWKVFLQYGSREKGTVELWEGAMAVGAGKN
ncbi:MAG TPA: hypothetical protein VF618_22305 [Thermoanaerobaculia bacterium]